LKSLYEQCNTTLPSVVLTDLCLVAISVTTTLFPSATTLICIWHANKAVLAWCQPAFPEADKWKEFYGFWHSIINSPSEEAYTERLLEFQQKYATEHFEDIGYIKSTWLVPFKEKLVRAWVDQSTHFGNRATFCVEGIYALLKSYLKKSTLDLFEAWKSIQLALLNQYSKVKSNQVKQQIQTPLGLSRTLYGAIQG